MAEATPDTVRGDFAGAEFEYAGVTSRFFRRDESFWIRTDGPDGELHDYRVAYTFGVEPLQQYLVAMPGGRLQALSIAWDTRPRDVGGQRWFHLYPDERIDHADVLHWTKPSQNWNDRCARCHSTELRRGYRAATDSYETTWQEVDVSCEACHGPGAKHVTWARRDPRPGRSSKGLRVRLRDRDGGAWVFDEGRPIARRSVPRSSHVEIDTCAPCHSRRSDFGDGPTAGVPYLDAHRPALLEEGLYFADGQIEDEVYVWGSFLQSRMYAAGVTCSDCHDPHALTTRGDGNALCSTCHAPSNFDVPAHTLHRPGTPGARCVDCHMPSRVYMGVDARRDHSFRVPDPTGSAAVGAPDACAGCHADRDAEWASNAIVGAGGGQRPPRRLGEILDAGRRGAVDAVARLSGLVDDDAAPAIARATAVDLLAGYSGPDVLATLVQAARDDDPLLRIAAATALDGQPPGIVSAAVGPLLHDPVRAVRLAAVPTFASVADAPEARPAVASYGEAESEYRAVQSADSDRADALLGLALVAQRRGRLDEAERLLRDAVRRAPAFVPSYLNLADLHRERGQDTLAEPILRGIVAQSPDSADAQHALGLLLVRTGRVDEAMGHLERAVALAPDRTRYAYVLGVALHSRGEIARALDVLEAAHERRPADTGVLVALATMSRDAGDLGAARRWADALVAAAPWDQAARRLRADLDALHERDAREQPHRFNEGKEAPE